MATGSSPLIAFRCVRGPILLLLVNALLFLSLSFLQGRWTESDGTNSPYVYDEGTTLRSRRGLTTSVSQYNAHLSTHNNIAIRGMYQKRRIQEYCKRHNYPGGNFLPTEQTALYQFKRHLIFDDERKVIFCFVPKVGSTNMKRMMLYMTNNLPMETVDWPWVDDTVYLEPALKKASFLSSELTEKDMMFRLQTYYKFMIVRDPLERIVSAFRDKLETPLKHPRWHNKFPEKVKRKILQLYKPNDLEFWLKTSGFDVYNISVHFDDYIRYLTETHSPDLNEHFQPQVDICHPCLVDYDFYGNFRTISQDVKELITKIEVNPKFYRDESLHTTSRKTSHYVLEYFSKLDDRERFRLLGSWYDEFLFYYTIYPSDQERLSSAIGV